MRRGLRSVADNARYAKSCHLVGDGELNRSQLIGGDGREGATRRNLLNGTLVVAQKMQQKAGWYSWLWCECCKSSSYANLSVGEVNDSDRSTNAYKHITQFCQFGRRRSLHRRLSKLNVPEVNLALMKFDTIDFIERISSRRLAHV